MKNRGVIAIMLLSLALALTWGYVNAYLRHKHPEWFVAKPAPAATDQNPAQSHQQAVAPPSTQIATTQAGVFIPVGGDGKSVPIGSDKFDPKGTGEYPLGVE